MMKRTLTLLTLILLTTTVAASVTLAQSPAPNPSTRNMQDLMQMTQSPTQNYNGLALGAGITYIDGKPYYLLHIAPQLQFDKIGIGIDGNIRFNPSEGIRKEDFNDAYDFIRWINYVSYGFPHDDLYLRVGGLEHINIGNGTIVSDYWNRSSYDNRRVGLVGRLNISGAGVEAMTSDLFGPGVLAVRPFVRPFEFIPSTKDMWLVHTLEIGATAAYDLDTNARRIIPNRTPYVVRPTGSDTNASVVGDSIRLGSPLSIYGIDISTMLWQADQSEGRLYADYIKFGQFSGGALIGLRTNLNLSSALLASFVVERSIFGDQFIPNYFNTMYERDRYDNQARPQDYITKTTLLANTVNGNGNGTRAGAFLSIANNLELMGNYLHLDNRPGKDWLDIGATLPNLGDQLFVSAIYSRKNIDGFNDIFALDERSLLTATASYKLSSFLIFTVIDRWTFRKDDKGNVVTQSMVEPRIDFVFQF